MLLEGWFEKRGYDQKTITRKRRKSYVGACSVIVRFYAMCHDQSLEGRISCTTKSMIFDNPSFMTGGTTMNDSWYDLFATDGTIYLRVRIAGEKF